MYIADEAVIKSGKITDVYFERALEVIQAKDLDKTVKAEITVKGLPEGYDWAVFCGLEEVLELLSSKQVNVRAIPEGTVFRENQPVIEIEGKYSEFAVYETAILGFLCEESGVATKSARMKKAAGGKTVLSFGARRMHPAVAPAIERAAYIGGCDGFSTVAAGDMLGIKPSGTMPHSLMLLIGDTLKAAEYFDEVVSSNVPRVVLIDTYGDEKFETIRVAERLNKKLSGIRLDTPSSRRGNMQKILEELRWELDIRGFKHVQLFVSGGLNEEKIKEIADLADGFGVGTSISNAPTIDFSMDIVEIEGKPIAKKGKMSGSKSFLRCNKCFASRVVPYTTSQVECNCGGVMEDLLGYKIRNGKLICEFEDIKTIKDRCFRELRHV
ncbi:nicotinate phosphoribosyltransferase [Hippea maritima]|uniref:nicotinate phosphoribosyltransferase n=1 Tax=Hippea maritima (strain ATCC 700847 / DSM 10411 / MH2) TaxID=760142 RepID=F2LX88_HIPMA|nr:nicotinate phosphoribosyltransferase [Hippea maritima]AEA33146.1 Nicotinate phosphoribosyltransferase [Hippea maritima DSM 10411]